MRDVEMFEKDLKRIRACVEYEDYYAAMKYASLVKDNYESREKSYLEDIIKYIKLGDYNEIRSKLD